VQQCEVKRTAAEAPDADIVKRMVRMRCGDRKNFVYPEALMADTIKGQTEIDRDKCQ
jgi:hypothetical protein